MEKINIDMCGCCNEIWANYNMKHIRLGKHILNLCPDCYAEYIKSFNKIQTQEQEPNISLEVYKQVTKERDIAIEQLHELGYEFGQKIESTTKKDCNTCTHSNETDGSNCYECVKDMCNNYEPTTKNDLDIINGLDDFIEFGKKAFGVELTIKKSDNPDTYAKLFGTTKNDLGVDVISRQALLNATVKRSSIWNHITNSEGDNLETIVSKLPSVTPIRPKGHWISHHIGAYYECSNCHEQNNSKNNSYCPNCGCRMESASNGNE